MTAAIATDQARDRERMMTGLRALARTDVPLVPVPFAERCQSPLWDSLTPRIRCSSCLERKPYEAFVSVREEPHLRYWPYQLCDDCREGTR